MTLFFVLCFLFLLGDVCSSVFALRAAEKDSAELRGLEWDQRQLDALQHVLGASKLEQTTGGVNIVDAYYTVYGCVFC